MVKRFFCCICCLLFLFACASSPSAAPKRLEAPGGDFRQYRLWIGETPVLFDAAGGILPEEMALTPLYDRGTRALCYYELTRYEMEGGEAPARELHALYDPKGEQVCGWTPGRFDPAFGGFVILHDAQYAVDPIYLPDDYSSALWDPRTGETVYDGAVRVEPLDNGTFVVSDIFNWGLAVLDREGNLVSTPTQDNLVDEEFHFERDEGPPYLFYENETVSLLDEGQRVIASFEYPGLDHVNRLKDGLYSYQIRLSRSTDRVGTRVGLLGPGLEVLLPADRYETITESGWGTGGDDPPCPLFAASYTLPGGAVRIDLLDETGQVVLDRLSQIGTADADRIAVVRGSKMGLIDTKGDWISQYSIYSVNSND